MKWKIISAIAVVLIAGCTGPQDTVTVTETAESAPIVEAVVTTEPVVTPDLPAELTSADWETIYIGTIRTSLDAQYDVISDSQFIETGYVICDALRAGNSVEDVALTIIGSGFDPAAGGTIMGAAIGAFCDEYTPDMDLFFSQYN